MDRAYKFIRELIKIGYDRKIGSWIVAYCLDNRTWMINILLR
jgi:hypothetical protein